METTTLFFHSQAERDGFVAREFPFLGMHKIVAETVDLSDFAAGHVTHKIQK